MRNVRNTSIAIALVALALVQMNNAVRAEATVDWTGPEQSTGPTSGTTIQPH